MKNFQIKFVVDYLVVRVFTPKTGACLDPLVSLVARENQINT